MGDLNNKNSLNKTYVMNWQNLILRRVTWVDVSLKIITCLEKSYLFSNIFHFLKIYFIGPILHPKYS